VIVVFGFSILQPGNGVRSSISRVVSRPSRDEAAAAVIAAAAAVAGGGDSSGSGGDIHGWFYDGIAPVHHQQQPPPRVRFVHDQPTESTKKGGGGGVAAEEGGVVTSGGRPTLQDVRMAAAALTRPTTDYHDEERTNTAPAQHKRNRFSEGESAFTPVRLSSTDSASVFKWSPYYLLALAPYKAPYEASLGAPYKAPHGAPYEAPPLHRATTTSNSDFAATTGPGSDVTSGEAMPAAEVEAMPAKKDSFDYCNKEFLHQSLAYLLSGPMGGIASGGGEEGRGRDGGSRNYAKRGSEGSGMTSSWTLDNLTRCLAVVDRQETAARTSAKSTPTQPYMFLTARGKRSAGCMRRCMTGGYLHPAQCHSLC